MMNFDEFLDAAKDRVQEAIPEAEVKIQQVNKLQGESYVGISVRPEGAAAAATFNVNDAFDRYRQNEGRLESILNRIAADADRVTASIPTFDVGLFESYDSVADRLVMQMVPIAGNEDMLATVPHKTVEDMAVVYRIDLGGRPDESASTLVTNSMIGQFGVTPEQLHEDAMVSQMTNRPPTLRNMSEVMAELSGGFMDIPESPMWVASVEGGLHGAVCTQFPEFLDQAADKLGGNFFVLPSSIQEVLFVPDNGDFERASLEQMVRNVNETEVSPQEFLSNTVYHYDSSAHVFERAAAFESRVAEQAAVYETAGPETAAEAMTVLMVEPESYPRTFEVGTELEDLQKAVGGNIEVTYPFDDNVGLIMNEEGKLNGLPLNRGLRDDDGQLYDVVAGSFMVVGLTDDGFTSLSPDQMVKYEEAFHQPEVFIRMGKGIMALPIPDEAVEVRQEKAAEKAREAAKPEKKTEPHEKKHKKVKEEAL